MCWWKECIQQWCTGLKTFWLKCTIWEELWETLVCVCPQRPSYNVLVDQTWNVIDDEVDPKFIRHMAAAQIILN